jgi:hypothetical protein
MFSLRHCILPLALAAGLSACQDRPAAPRGEVAEAPGGQLDAGGLMPVGPPPNALVPPTLAPATSAAPVLPSPPPDQVTHSPADPNANPDAVNK